MKIVETLNKRYKSCPKLYFVEVKPEAVQNQTLKEFIKDFFYIYNEKYKSVKVKSGQVLPTWKRLRSMQDLFATCRFYYKDVKFEDVAKCLFELAKEKKLQGRWFCNTVRKYVFSKDNTPYDKSMIRKDIISTKNDERIDALYKELGYTENDFEL